MSMEPAQNSEPESLADGEQRRQTLRRAIFGALAATGYLALPKDAQAQTRTSLSSLQNDVNLLQQFDSAVSTAISDLQSAVSGTGTTLAALGTDVDSLMDAVDAILDGNAAVGAVNGFVKLTSTPGIADASTAGELRYSPTVQRPVFSDGTQWNALATGAPTVFTRYGNSTAPLGCQLLTSGVLAAGYYNHSGGIAKPIVLPANMSLQASSRGSSGSLIYQMVIAEPVSSDWSFGNRTVPAAVCLAPRPVHVFWGTTTPPAGWTAIYSGLGMAAHYTHSCQYEPILIDTQNFSGQTVSISSGDNALLYALKSWGGQGLPGSSGNYYLVRGVLAMMDA